ncbi:MAG: hypothetical protein U1F25_13760 [Rubrivivax sp.]
MFFRAHQIAAANPPANAITIRLGTMMTRGSLSPAAACSAFTAGTSRSGGTESRAHRVGDPLRCVRVQARLFLPALMPPVTRLGVRTVAAMA